MKVNPRWLLASDLHFKLHDLDRVTRTADWIASLPSEYNISRVIICGDVLTARTSQPTSVLAACYRFLGKLAGAVPHVDVILGNHDLAYRRDYTTSALEALAISRLAPFVTLHTEIACHKWDKRRVLVMPFREDQGEIVRYIRDLSPAIAAKTVGFGHLAINRAITQKHTIDPETGNPGLPSRYPGLTSAGEFAPLARTFTGHFHSHQTIFQPTDKTHQDPRGSITYIGAPLQLTWADLLDTRRGVILLDPQNLEHELIENPYAVGYTSVGAQEVLADRVDAEQVQDKHAMITGKSSMYKYISARDRLVKLGVRSVRDWKHTVSGWQFAQTGLGNSMLPADIQVRPGIKEKETVSQETGDTQTDLASPSTAISQELTKDEMKHRPLDLDKLVQEYVSSLELESTLADRRDILLLVGKRLFDVQSCATDKADYKVKYKDMLDPSPQSTLFIPENDTTRTSTAETIFAADPISIEITNFLGVQGTLSLDFKHHFQPGINLIVGHNGAGKSTIIEAIVWCQFGQCIRGGLGVNDIVNDVAGKNCNVRLTFANGYAISRSRKHNKFHNRVIVEKNGIIQPQFEGPDIKSTQASIDSLLGVDFDTFIRIVLLGNESAPSFLSSTSLQKRQLIESVLGLKVLDGCADTCTLMLNQVKEELGGIQSRLEGVAHTVEHLKNRVNQVNQTLGNLRHKVSSLTNEMEAKKRKHIALLNEKERRKNKLQEELTAQQLLPDLQPKLLSLQSDISLAQNEVNRLGVLARLAQARSFIDRERLIVEQEVVATITQLHHLNDDLRRLVQESSTLEVPPPAIQEDEYRKEEGAGNMRGFLLNITLAFRKFWTLALHAVSSAARERARIAEEIAFKAMEARRRWAEHVKAMTTVADRLNHAQGRIGNVIESVTGIYRNVSSQTHISESDIRLALRTLTAQEALKIPSRLSVAIDELRTLSKRHDRLQFEHKSQEQQRFRKIHELEKQEREIEMARKGWADSSDRLRLLLASKEQEITTYKELLKSEVESLAKLKLQAVELSKEMTSIQSHQEIFAFWQYALTRRQVAASRATFRRYVIGRHLGELNKLLVEILMFMYQDAHYARSMVAGTLKTLFEEDGEVANNDPDDGTATSVLDPSLSMSVTLGYAKKSGGERKRVDLALFFALFVMSEARSPHRTGYMLVDEAFDGLDTAGQAAVLKLCRRMARPLAYVFVITHSQSFVRLAEHEDANAAGTSVVTAKAGDHGTEFEINGVRVRSSPLV
ncbi:P-loop containing nucleoside triphosphate hydrolase protein [Biscogniauxia sp. FL1348]|nr:P-loop containing nucleoside triphosphate hydrolase protein [Biscogniauxia sp. FL1348]